MSEPRFDASAMLVEAATRQGICLPTLVAETALWAHPQAHQHLVVSTGHVAVYPNCRRARAGQGESRRQRIGNIILDDNTYANNAIKRALGLMRADLRGFETCHIWPLTCYNDQYHTAIANLVLIPRALAALTDHDSNVSAALQFRAYELYNWHPAESPRPSRPQNYPKTWLDPLPLKSRVAPHKQTQSRNTFDVIVSGVTTPNLPKRTAMLTMVRGLVAAGITPEAIQSVLHWRGSRLFKSASGRLSGEEFVKTLTAEARMRGRAFDSKRFFCDEAQLIYASGRTYSFSNQWGDDTEQAIDALLKSFPSHAVSCDRTRHY